MKNIPYLLAKEKISASPVLLLCENQKEALYCQELYAYWTEGKKGKKRALLFPEWETLPYDEYRAPQILVNQRLQFLQEIRNNSPEVLITSAPALRQYLCPPEFLDFYGAYYFVGQKISASELEKRLIQAEYKRQNIVQNKGEFNHFGDFIDFFPQESEYVLRIQFQNNQISQISGLNPATHTTVVQTKSINLIPKHEVNLDKFTKPESNISLDYFLPLSHHYCVDFFNYLPKSTQIIASENLASALVNHQNLCKQRYPQKSALAPEKLWLDAEKCLEKISQYQTLKFKNKVENLQFHGTMQQKQAQWNKLATQAVIHQNDYLSGSPLRHSFRCGDDIHLVALDLEINPETTPENVLQINDLKIGAPIIHYDYGIGRYAGLHEFEGEELLKIEYQGSALMLTLEEISALIPYGGNPENAPWHRLGEKNWKNIQEKIKKETSDIAAELLEIYAEREKSSGLSLTCAPEEMNSFAKLFPYQLTPDQESALQAVYEDLASSRPMDRLVCGDVGFGKTEVALRAAFVAIAAGYQVAFIAPTTLLAEQHEQQCNFRFADFAQISALTRFKNKKEQQEIIHKLELGDIDLVVGTHRLLQDDVKFKRLGLLIIDEEQRFGVKAKERLKRFRSDINILTLSATPIPRTLNMAFNGLRDLSIINTAPQGRQSINTQMMTWDADLIRDACQRELARGGQIYFLHNDVDSMPRINNLLQEIMPNLRIGIAHGQMKERELEQVMLDFQQKKYDLLLSSTIIESGLDIANANTILINRADKLGLGQLHQLRGRVGRSNRQAFAYLIIPEESLLGETAQKRLEAFSQQDSLGAGFLLATQDLEIRGAGAILGDKQSGQMNIFGVSYYLQQLKQALQQKQKTYHEKVKIKRLLQPHFSNDYINNPAKRLRFYQRLNLAESNIEINKIRHEIEQIYGVADEYNQEIFLQHQIRILAENLGIREIVEKENYWQIFIADFDVFPREKLLKALKLSPHLFKINEENSFLYLHEKKDNFAVLEKLQLLLQNLKD